MRGNASSLAALAVCLITAAGCSGGGGSPAPAPSPTIPVITIVGDNGAQAFSPNPGSFGGQQVTFKNNTSITHRVTLNDGTLDTGDIAPGATSRAVTMPGTGTNYHCTIHPGMIGSISAASGAPPPTCTGDYCTPY